jgi:2-keto-3-deoxy-L-rhamnonate aldolase RhmA
LANFPILLRPAATDGAGLRLAMDLGPCGLLLPMIESVEQLDRACNDVYLPPRGQRRPGGPSNYWVHQYTYETFRRHVEDPLIVIPQIESPLGVENAEAIARHPLTTALGVGPFDLSIRLGVSGESDHPKLRKSLAQIRSAAIDAGKPAWMIGDGPALIAQGYRFICIGEPSLLLKARLIEIVESSWAQHRAGWHDENR